MVALRARKVWSTGPDLLAAIAAFPDHFVRLMRLNVLVGMCCVVVSSRTLDVGNLGYPGKILFAAGKAGIDENVEGFDGGSYKKVCKLLLVSYSAIIST